MLAHIITFTVMLSITTIAIKALRNTKPKRPMTSMQIACAICMVAVSVASLFVSIIAVSVSMFLIAFTALVMEMINDDNRTLDPNNWSA